MRVDRVIISPRIIETATDFHSAIEIIPESICDLAMSNMQRLFQRLFSDPTQVSVVPILFGGEAVGNELVASFGIPTNPMRVEKYVKDGPPLPEPVCRMPPDIKAMLLEPIKYQTGKIYIDRIKM